MSWTNCTLADISTNIQTGPFGSQLHQSDYSECGIPVVMPKDLIEGHISEDSIARVSEDHVERLSRHKIEEGDILYSRRGDVGRCAYAGHKEVGWLCGTGCLRVSINAQIANPKFVFYQLQKVETIGWVINHAIGATMLNLNTSILSAVPIELPDLQIQNHIVSILSAYDDLIEGNQKQIELLEEAAKRLYKEWFVDLRFPGCENVKMVDGIPGGWKIKTIGELCQRINAGGTPSRSKKIYWDNPSVKWFKTGELQDCWLIDSDEMISIAGLEGSSAKMFPRNTILMAIYASPTLGRLGVLTSEAACNQAALCMLVDESKVSWQWLYYKLLELRDYFNSVAKGAGQQNISADTVKKKEIVLPEKKIIDQFSEIVSSMFDNRLCLQEENKTLGEARDRLLPKLMSGEIEL